MTHSVVPYFPVSSIFSSCVIGQWSIYKNQKNDAYDTKPGNIAKKLGISNAAATDMAKKLSARNLINYEKYQQLTLTKEGTKMALDVVRKHRLWEAFLFKTFDMSLHDIHREAELLEHQTSDFLAEHLSAYLGNPEFDPHGDPIPNAAGEITTTDTSIALSKAKAGKSYKITRLLSDDKEFFDFCSQLMAVDVAKYNSQRLKFFEIIYYLNSSNVSSMPYFITFFKMFKYGWI